MEKELQKQFDKQETINAKTERALLELKGKLDALVDVKEKPAGLRPDPLNADKWHSISTCHFGDITIMEKAKLINEEKGIGVVVCLVMQGDSLISATSTVVSPYNFRAVPGPDGKPITTLMNKNALSM